jgi:hypothetical protein
MGAPLTVNWTFTSQIAGGPQISESQPAIGVWGYDYVTKTLAGASTGIDVHLEPATTTASMVAVLADQYSTNVTYNVDGGTDVRKLDGPHLFLGQGAVAYMSSLGNPQKLTFANTGTGTVTVRVFVGRAA